MIICHCQGISDADIDVAIDWMRASDPHTLITPGKIYRALGKAADCGACLPLFLSEMRKNENLKVPAAFAKRPDDAIPSLRPDFEVKEFQHARRSEGN